MFKDIQKKLLLKYPLLWNTKFVPMLIIGIIYHILYFILGYAEGSIDFTGKTYDTNNEVAINFFGFLLSLIIIILWIVYYLRNNSFKALYKKSKNALFYEWLQIFIISFFFISFALPFYLGKQLRERSYYSYEETQKRCETISLADVFIDGSFAETERDSIKQEDYIAENEDNNEYNEYDNEEYNRNGYHYFYKDHLYYKGKKYNENSLINRQIDNFDIINYEREIQLEEQIKNWLHTNNKVAVKNLMNDFFKIHTEHQLKTNLELSKWFSITYNAPDFTNFLYITPYDFSEEDIENQNYYDYAIDDYSRSSSNKKYSKYFFQYDILKQKYNKVSNAHVDPLFEYNAVLAFLYGSLAFSLLLFSFKTTSGKSWLIALIVFGVLNIIIGLGSVLIRYSYNYTIAETITYLSICLLFILFFIGYYIINTHIQKNKKFTEIALILSTWTFSMVIPFIYFIILEHYKDTYIFNELGTNTRTEFYYILTDFVPYMFLINFIISIIALFLFSRSIRTWKGLPEN